MSVIYECIRVNILGQNLKNWTRKVLNLSSLYVLSLFKYFQIHIFGQISLKKSDKKKFELCQMTFYSQRFLNYIKRQND